MRRTQLAIGIGLLVGVVACLAAADGYVIAQSARNGVRVQLGQIAASGGLAGQAFIPIPPSAVHVESVEATPCTGVRLTAVGRLPRGPVRAVDLSLMLNETGREGELGAGACPGATIAFELEDGSRVAIDRGEIDVTQLDLRGGLVEVRFQGTGVRRGDPITITGEVRLQYRRSEP